MPFALTRIKKLLSTGALLFATSVVYGQQTNSATAVAQTPDVSIQEENPADLIRLNNLIEQEQYQEAYAFAAQMIEFWGGDENFDFLAGRAAFALEQYEEAVFAFERVMINRPDSLRARLFLAFGYFKVNNYGAAKTELTRLLSSPLEPEQLAKVQEYLDIIAESERRALFNQVFTAQFGHGYDSNVNSGATIDTIVIPVIGEIELFAGSQETSDTVSDYNFSYAMQKKITQLSSYSLQASVNYTQHQDVSTLDRTVANLVAGYQDSYKSMQYNVSAYVQPMLLDGDYYRIAYGVLGEATWPLSDHWALTLGLGAAMVDNQVNDNQDLEQLSAKTRLTYFGSKVHMLEVSYGDDKAKELTGANNGKEVITATYRFIYPISATWNLAATLGYQDAKHAAIHPTFLIIREDETVSAGLNIDYIFNQSWRMSGIASYSDKKSNLDLYNFDRSAAKLLFSYIF